MDYFNILTQYPTKPRLLIGAASYIALLLLSCPIAAADLQITDFADLTFGTWDASGDESSDDGLCVHDSDAAGSYNITATGSGAGSAFEVQSGGDNLAYEVEFSGSVGGFQALSAGVSKSFSSASLSSNCSGGTNANLRVIFRESQLEVSQAGSYSGTLTVLLEP